MAHMYVPGIVVKIYDLGDQGARCLALISHRTGVRA